MSEEYRLTSNETSNASVKAINEIAFASNGKQMKSSMKQILECQVTWNNQRFGDGGDNMICEYMLR